MDECVLSDNLDDEGQKLLFDFDYMTDRNLYMELREIVTGRVLKDPVCTLSLGQAPPQFVDIDEFTDNLDAKAAKAATDLEDLDAEFYGSDEYDPEEFEAEGFDEMRYN